MICYCAVAGYTAILDAGIDLERGLRKNDLQFSKKVLSFFFFFFFFENMDTFLLIGYNEL